jgi:hypothetical protein
VNRITRSNRPTWAGAGLAALGLALALSAGLAHAGGTPSNTTISNTATLNYTVSGVAQAAIGSSPGGNSVGAGTPTTFLVDKKVNLTVTATDGTFVSVTPGSSAQVTTFSVTNTGNDAQDFALTSSQVASGQALFGGTDNFDATGCAQFVESGATAGYQAGQDTATFINSLAADQSKTVYVVCNIPAGQVNGDVAIVALTATAKVAGSGGTGALTQTVGANTAGVDIVFADGAGSDDAVRDAAFSARDAYKVSSSAITVAKTATLICDPVNSTTNPKNIPGAIVKWTVTITNGAGASASAILNTVTDTLDANTTFDVNLVTGAGGAAGCSSAGGTPESGAGKGFRVQSSVGTRPVGAGTGSAYFTSANDSDGVDYNTGVVTASFGTALPAGGGYLAGELKAGESVTFYYNVAVK